MRKYTSNYSWTNNNYVIRNLNSCIKDYKHKHAVYILKNILQRGRPTIMSEYLQNKFNVLHKQKNYKTPKVLIDNTQLVWKSTIKGDDTNNYFPARDFLEKCIDEDLSEYNYIKQLILPEALINEITQFEDKRFLNQAVDFYLPQAFLVIEIDGQQHKEELGRLSDKERDLHLNKSGIKTIRINTKDLSSKNQEYYLRISEIRERLNESKILKHYSNSYQSYKDISEDIIEYKMKPTAVMRFQILILELIDSGILNLDEKEWILNVRNRDISGYEKYAIEDVFIWLKHICALQKIDFNRPNYKINNKKIFNEPKNINIDFSLLQRWTDESDFNKNVIYVRSDYYDVYINRDFKKQSRVNNFKVSTTTPYKYKFFFNEEQNDEEHLKFFLRNIYGYENFNAGQLSILQNALEYRDTIGLLPTGGGKSLIYQLACLLQPCISFVVCPIKSLMTDQVFDLESIQINHTSAVTSDIETEKREEILKDFGNGRLFFIYISPERFQNQLFRDRLKAIKSQMHFSYAVVDEVHCLSEWGHDFRLSYLNLSNTIKTYCGNVKFLGLTATASVNVLKDIQLEFNIKNHDVKTLVDYTRPELEFEVINSSRNKYENLVKLLNDINDKENVFSSKTEEKAGLIFTPFVNGNHGCHRISTKLKDSLGENIDYYSGSKPKYFSGNENDFDIYKKTVQKDFKENKFSLLVATKAFGMGINKKNIRYTIHYGIPSSMESLYQEAGRAGRDKNLAKCYVLLTPEHKSTPVNKVFVPNNSYENLAEILKDAGFKSEDVLRQLYLYQSGQEPIDSELEEIIKVYDTYAKPNIKVIINAKHINSTKHNVEKAIYRLSNLGVVKDWIIENFQSGIFIVKFTDYKDSDIKNNLLTFIRKYNNDFEFENSDYDRYFYNKSNNTLQQCAEVLLRWTYDKFGANRRESLKNVYYTCLECDNTSKGKELFKQKLEAYFKFSDATYVLQEIAENNNKLIEKWFSVLYGEDNKLLDRNGLIDIEGNLKRFLESFQTNTGLNLINGIVQLLLYSDTKDVSFIRFNKALQEIYKNYRDIDYDYIIDQLLEIAKEMRDKGKTIIHNCLKEYCRDENLKYILAKETNDTEYLLKHYNELLTNVLNNIENGYK